MAVLISKIPSHSITARGAGPGVEGAADNLYFNLKVPEWYLTRRFWTLKVIEGCLLRRSVLDFGRRVWTERPRLFTLLT